MPCFCFVVTSSLMKFSGPNSRTSTDFRRSAALTPAPRGCHDQGSDDQLLLVVAMEADLVAERCASVFIR